MPTYEYECQKCGHIFELSQSIKAAPVKKCPKCKADSAKRLISAGGGFILKGRGFYATDYKKSKHSLPKCDNAGKKSDCSSCPGAH
ncbi:MAG: zinc ribbon domain-containing protein [Candidatus Omnitrophica bacterium]|nr:zinc ribbon domain-containing protein [Candidatus Omnitrophota bacterium]